jgi:hypothetical protein
MSLDNVQVSENIFMIFRRLGHTVGSNFSFKMILIAPEILHIHFPDIYKQLTHYYRQDTLPRRQTS